LLYEPLADESTQALLPALWIPLLDPARNHPLGTHFGTHCPGDRVVDTMSAAIWLLEMSADDGETWVMEQAHGFYKNKDRAEKRAELETKHHQALSPANYRRNYIYRVREYASVDVAGLAGAA
jgi:hypothetical protein